LLAALAACGAEHEEPGPAPASVPAGWPVSVELAGETRHRYERVVLVTIDTLRADHVSCYGYPRETTPFLDRLAERGARFTRAIAAFSCTAPSHATMLTGLVPAVHGVLENGGELDSAATDLADVFARAGFETAAFLNAGFLRGIAGSFARVEVGALGRRKRVASGAEVVDAAIAWLERERKGARFFLWLHLYDPHEWFRRVREHGDDPEPIWSGATPDGFLARVAEIHGLPPSEPGEPLALSWDVADGGEHGPFGPERFPSFIDAYDELTLFADRQVARLYERLEALGLPGRTLWVVTSDHGEGLASHGVSGHGARVYQEQLHVPLIVHASDGSVPARVVGELAAHVDLFPTLAETLGLAVSAHPELYDGRSLWPLLRGDPTAWPERFVLSQRQVEGLRPPDPVELYALQDARRKLILHVPARGASGPRARELYDLEADPRELADLGAAHADAAELEALLEERLRCYRALAPARREAEVPEEWLQELRDLGYAR
jgi:arylsulfatase A-like enzyme